VWQLADCPVRDKIWVEKFEPLLFKSRRDEIFPIDLCSGGIILNYSEVCVTFFRAWFFFKRMTDSIICRFIRMHPKKWPAPDFSFSLQSKKSNNDGNQQAGRGSCGLFKEKRSRDS
jgi:hypothetical protein